MSKKRGKRTAGSDAQAARGKRATPVAEAALVEASAIEAPAIEAPAVEAGVVEMPAIEAVAVDAPAVEASVEEAPVAEMPVAEAPVVAAPARRITRPSAAYPRPPVPEGAYALLAHYDRRSLAHDPGVPEQIEAPGLWRAIGFRVGDHNFVSGIDEISEILISPPPVTSIPSTRPWLMGVANVRGNLIALVDLKQFLFEKRTHVTQRARVLVVRQNGGNVGLLVDELLGQRNLTDADRAGSEGESDPGLARFVTENVTLGATRLGRFSMVDLTHAPEFAHAST